MLHPSGGRWGRIIRPARPEDVPTIRNIVDASYRRYIPRIGRPHGPMLDDYGRRVTDNRAWVLQEAGRVVAILVLEHTAEGFRLDNIAVAPEAQGGGCRRMLIAFTETEAKRHGCREIHLNTHALMTENQALYQRLGFAETRRIAQQGFDRVYMTKPWPDIRRGRLQSAARQPTGTWLTRYRVSPQASILVRPRGEP